MRRKKLKLSAVLLLGLGLVSLQAQSMCMKEKSGTETAYALSSVRKMTFSGGDATVQKTDNNIGVHTLSGLQYLNFGDYTTGIEGQIQINNANFNAYPNPVRDLLTIDLSGETIEGTISILTLDGKLLQAQKSDGSNTVTFNLSQLPQGIYLCLYASTIEIKTVKIIKQ